VSVAALLAAGALACPTFPGTQAARQLVTVDARPGATSAALTFWDRRGACWTRVAGPWTARLGRAGLSAHKREGDGSTPVGTYRLGATVYGIAPDPGLHLAYHRLVCGDWWDEDTASSTYNTFRHLPCGARPTFGAASEALWRISPQYRYFAVIDYNDDPVVHGRGSAIFLHVAAGATAGCISLPERRLVSLLRALRPSPAPLIRIAFSST
jgi:L,D-peptidoglycan transpeptidase YkuD (ErfK/YbiS/YcfS/YnhG family)